MIGKLADMLSFVDLPAGAASKLAGKDPEGGWDLHSHFGTTLGGSVDLRWTIDRLLDLAITDELNSNRKEAFDIEEWANRKASQGAGLRIRAIADFIDSYLYQYVYPKLGTNLYQNEAFYTAFGALKQALNMSIVWANWDKLKAN